MVNENGGRKTIPKFEAFVKQLALRWRHCRRLNDGPIALKHAREVLVVIAEARLSITISRQMDNSNQPNASLMGLRILTRIGATMGTLSQPRSFPSIHVKACEIEST